MAGAGGPPQPCRLSLGVPHVSDPARGPHRGLAPARPAPPAEPAGGRGPRGRTLGLPAPDRARPPHLRQCLKPLCQEGSPRQQNRVSGLAPLLPRTCDSTSVRLSGRPARGARSWASGGGPRPPGEEAQPRPPLRRSLWAWVGRAAGGGAAPLLPPPLCPSGCCRGCRGSRTSRRDGGPPARPPHPEAGARRCGGPFHRGADTSVKYHV